MPDAGWRGPSPTRVVNVRDCLTERAGPTKQFTVRTPNGIL
jgi:hypothetical protein